MPERPCQPLHLRSPQGRLRGQVDGSAHSTDEEHRGNPAGRARQAAGKEVRPSPRRHRHDGGADEGLPEQRPRRLSATGQFSPQGAHEVPRRHQAAGGKGEAEGGEQRGAADVRGDGDNAACVHGRLDDHPAQRMDGVLARIAGVCRYQEQRLADDGRRQAKQCRSDQAAAAGRAEGAKAHRPCDRPRDDDIGRGSGYSKEAREREPAQVSIAEQPGLARTVHSGQPRYQRERDRRRRQRDGQEVEVHRKLESHHAAGHAVGGQQQRPELQCRQRCLRQCGQCPANCGAHLRVTPAGVRHEHDAGPPGAPPLHARVQHDRPGGAQAEQEQQRERDDMLGGHVRVEDGHHPEDRNGADVLEGRRGGRQREATVGVHDRGRRAHDRVQRHLRQQEQYQQRTDVHFAARGWSAGRA